MFLYFQNTKMFAVHCLIGCVLLLAFSRSSASKVSDYETPLSFRAAAQAKNPVFNLLFDLRKLETVQSGVIWAIFGAKSSNWTVQNFLRKYYILFKKLSIGLPIDVLRETIAGKFQKKIDETKKKAYEEKVKKNRKFLNKIGKRILLS